MKHHYLKRQIVLATLTICLFVFRTQAQTYFDLSTGNYTENFSDIANTTNWPNGFNGSSSTEWRGLAAGGSATIPDATRITTSTTSFVTSSTGGVQRGSENIQLLSTGATDNTSSSAIDLFLKFTGRNADSLKMDLACVFNSTGNRVSSLKVYYSTNNGTSFTEISGGGLPYSATNNVAGSQAVAVKLPAALNNVDSVRLRFYYHNGSGGSTGSRPKISIDNIEVSTVAGNTPTLNISPTSNNFGTVTVGSPSAGVSFSINGSALTGAPGNITITRPNSDFQVSLNNSAWSASVDIPYSAATLDSTGFYVRFDPQSAGAKSGNLSISGGGVSSPPTISLSGTGATSSTASNVIIAAGFTEPENIAYSTFQAADITDANSIEVARFTLQDGGNSLNDGDALATTLTAITFNVTNHANLRRIALYDGTTELGEVAAGATAAFSGLTAAAADNGSKNLSIRVTFAASVTDRAQFSFTVASVTADAAGSLFAAADGGAAASSTTGDRNKIQVTATAFAFVQQPSNASSGNNMTPAVTVSANDALGNRDLDFTGNVQITSTGTLTGTPVVQAAVSGLATFSALVHTGTGTGLKLTAARNPEADRTVESNTFDLVQLPAAGEIVINQFSQDYNGASDEYVELVNKTNKTFDLSLLKLSYQAASGSAGGAGGNLSGTLAPYSFWLLSPNASITVGLTNGLARDGSFTAGFAAGSGQIALQIIADNTIIDAVGYGTITGGTFTEGGNSAAMTSPPADGGGKRTTDGVDTDNNSNDFSTVTNANIYLRNSSSRLAVTGASIAAGTYTDLVVTGNASLSGAVNLNNRLELVSGALTTNGHLTITSTAANDAVNVLGGTNASLVGNVTVQRFLPWSSANNNGFRFVSHPLRSNPQLSAITNLPAAANTVIGYDEDLNTTQGGYIVLNDRSVTLGQAKSIGVWTNAANTLSFTGELQLDAIASVAVDFAGTSTGWNFMGNPFPNALDWDEVTKSSTVNNATYVWIKDNLALGGGSWGTYINGTAANGGSRYLAPGQGFVVKATGTSPAPSLGFPTASRVSSQSPTYNVTATLPDELRLRVNRWDNGTRFETVVKFAQDATTDFDPLYDAELMSDGRTHTPDLYTIDANGGKYTIQTLPMPSGEHELLPLQLETFGAGSFSFDVDLSKLRAVGKVELEDTKLNRFITLVNNSQVVFTTDTNDAIGRFVLHFNRADRTHSTVSVGENVFNQVNVYSFENEIFVRGLERADQLRILDLSGRVVFELAQPDFTVGTIRPHLAAGTYLVNLTKNGAVKTVKVVLQ